MPALERFESALTPAERELVTGLSNPAAIQAFLDDIAYSDEPIYRCPLRVLRDRKGHCFDGAIFAAAMLRRLGYPPLIVDMIPNERDDDHLLAVYKRAGHWGAVAKSNFSGLRYREPIFRSLRELVLSYFEDFFNVAREKTLRAYTRPLNLQGFDRLDWMMRDEPLERIAGRLGEIRQVRLLTPEMVAGLSAADERSYRAGLLGSNPHGLWRPAR